MSSKYLLQDRKRKKQTNKQKREVRQKERKRKKASAHLGAACQLLTQLFCSSLAFGGNVAGSVSSDDMQRRRARN